MDYLLANEHFWIFIGFVIFVFLCYKPLKLRIVRYIDEGIASIKMQINESEKAYNDAEVLLHNIKEQFDKLCELRTQMTYEYETTKHDIKQKHARQLLILENKCKHNISQYTQNANATLVHVVKSRVIDSVLHLITEYTNNSNITDPQIVKNLISKQSSTLYQAQDPKK